MSLAVLPDHRGSDDRRLLRALQRRDPLALVEAHHRTATAAATCARRLLGSPEAVEALLYAVYCALWDGPPTDTALERWVRAQCFTLGSRHLRDLGGAPASPSTALLLPDLPGAAFDPSDPAERAIAGLDPAARRALLLAHDRGIPSGEQPEPGAPTALQRALLALAGPDEAEEAAAAAADPRLLADWTLGLLPPERQAEVAARLEASPAAVTLARALRRGRGRLEIGATNTDLGTRVLVAVLTRGRVTGAKPEPPEPPGLEDGGEPGRAVGRPGGSAEPGLGAGRALAIDLRDPDPPPATAHEPGVEPSPAPSWSRRAAFTLAAAAATAAAVFFGLEGGIRP